ncbi:MAG: SDR family NAD(P)-dependent oxidoreductase [Paracoccaceae bacterium]
MAKMHNSEGLAGLKFLITGATSGLGFGISIALAKEGAEIIAIGRDKKRLEDLSDAIEQNKWICCPRLYRLGKTRHN